MTNEATEAVREDTMIYRSVAPDTDQAAVQEIWGERLEVRTVDASEVPSLLAEGWVTHPMDIGKAPELPAPTPEELDASKDALEAAEKLVETLTKERDEAAVASKAAHETATNLGNQVEALKADNAKLAGDLKAAEELADAETKAKDAALAEVETIKAAKATLTAKPKGS